MKKILTIILCMIISETAGLCAWEQIVPGLYMNNFSVKNKVIYGSYKYTADYEPFREDMKLIPQARELKVYSFTQDVTLNCETKKVTMTNMTYYDKTGKAVYKVPENISGNADPEMLKACKQAGL